MGGGEYSIVACLSRVTIDRASLAKQGSIGILWFQFEPCTEYLLSPAYEREVGSSKIAAFTLPHPPALGICLEGYIQSCRSRQPAEVFIAKGHSRLVGLEICGQERRQVE